MVSRWDSGNYIELGLRGYQHCPPRGPTLPVRAPGCNLAFYPTYGLVGRYVAKLTGLAIDFAMLAVSLVASFIFLYLWTGKELTSRLGVGDDLPGARLLQRLHDRLLPGHGPDRAADAGAGAGRLRGVRRAAGGCWAPCWPAPPAASASPAWPIGIAFAAGSACRAPAASGPARPGPGSAPRCWRPSASGDSWRSWPTTRIGSAIPLTYIHAHGQLFHHEHPGLGALFPPDPEKIIGSIEWPLHEGLWLAAALLWFALGHREALRRFPIPEQAFWYVAFLATVGIATVGMMPLALAGMSRYLLLAFPMFFAMGATMRRRPLLALVWIGISAWHYWNIDICTYTGGMGDHTFMVCHEPWWAHH